MNLPILRLGQALVIAGPQGSGKTRLADAIANVRGSYAQIDFRLQAKNAKAINDVLAAEPKTVIVDGVELDWLKTPQAKALFTQPWAIVKTPHQHSRTVDTPCFIFVLTGEVVFLPRHELDYRFNVVNCDLKGPGQ